MLIHGLMNLILYKESNEELNAMKKIFTRSYIKEPKASIRTDGSSEFKVRFS